MGFEPTTPTLARLEGYSVLGNVVSGLGVWVGMAAQMVPNFSRLFPRCSPCAIERRYGDDRPTMDPREKNREKTTRREFLKRRHVTNLRLSFRPIRVSQPRM